MACCTGSHGKYKGVQEAEDGTREVLRTAFIGFSLGHTKTFSIG